MNDAGYKDTSKIFLVKSGIEDVMNNSNDLDLNLKGEFVELSLLEETDAEVTLTWRNKDRAKYLNRVTLNVSEQEKWIRSRPETEKNFVLALKTGEKVGTLSLVNIDLENKRAESARFLIGEEEKCAGLPIAVEAMFLLYEYAFNDLGLTRLYGHIQSSNTMMIKWQKFLGMKEEGIWRNHYISNDGYDNAILLGILREEYFRVARQRFKSLIKMGTK